MNRSQLGIVVAAAFGTFAAHAEDAFKAWKWEAKKWARSDERAAKTGDTTIEEGEESVRRTTDVRMPGGTAMERVQDVDAGSAFKLHREVSGVSASKVTGLRVNVERFQTREHATWDRTLEGKTVAVTMPVKEKDAPTAKVLDEKKTPVTVSPDIEQWIATRVATTRDERLEAVLPEKGVRSDEEWSVDPRTIAPVFFDGAKVPLDASRSWCKGKLTGVRVQEGEHVGHVEVVVKLQLAGLPGNATGKWTKGGLYEWKLVYDGSLDRRLGSLLVTATLEGACEVTTPQGKAALEVSSEERTERSLSRGPKK